MNNTQTNAAPAGPVTAQYDFHHATINGENLFSVRAGIPLSDALDQLSSLVSSSIASIEFMATESIDSGDIQGSLWQSVHLLNFAYALIQSIHGGHFAHAKGQS